MDFQKLRIKAKLKILLLIQTALTGCLYSFGQNKIYEFSIVLGTTQSYVHGKLTDPKNETFFSPNTVPSRWIGGHLAFKKNHFLVAFTKRKISIEPPAWKHAPYAPIGGDLKRLNTIKFNYSRLIWNKGRWSFLLGAGADFGNIEYFDTLRDYHLKGEVSIDLKGDGTDDFEMTFYGTHISPWYATLNINTTIQYEVVPRLSLGVCYERSYGLVDFYKYEYSYRSFAILGNGTIVHNATSTNLGITLRYLFKYSAQY